MIAHTRGFTLIETIFALVIFSVMATGFLYYTGKQARELDYLTDKTLAAVIAENIMTEMRSGQNMQASDLVLSVTPAMLKASRWPETGNFIRDLPMAQKQWRAYVDVEDTFYANLRRVQINVMRTDVAADSSTSLVLLTGFLGKN